MKHKIIYREEEEEEIEGGAGGQGGQGGTSPAGGQQPPAGGQGGQQPPAGGDNDPVKMAQELGRLKKVEEDFDKYKKDVEPVIQTLYQEPELLTKTVEAYNKRMGLPTGTPAPAGGVPPANGQPAAPTDDGGVRNSQINLITERFEEGAGINKLSDEDKQKARGLIGNMLKEMLDPKGNKTIAQVLGEVNLQKLPFYLDSAWKIVNRDNDMRAAADKAKSEVMQEYEGARGVIGPMGGSSGGSGEQVTLTPQERATAAKMGISEEKYLEGKKKVLVARS